MDPAFLVSLNNAISVAQRLREVSKNIADAEFKNLLADLYSQLGDAKLEAANVKAELAVLMEENTELRRVRETEEEPSGSKWGCYQFEGDDGLFCTACWDTKKQKCRTSRTVGPFRMCPVCNAVMGR